MPSGLETAGARDMGFVVQSRQQERDEAVADVTQQNVLCSGIKWAVGRAERQLCHHNKAFNGPKWHEVLRSSAQNSEILRDIHVILPTTSAAGRLAWR